MTRDRRLAGPDNSVSGTRPGTLRFDENGGLNLHRSSHPELTVGKSAYGERDASSILQSQCTRVDMMKYICTDLGGFTLI